MGYELMKASAGVEVSLSFPDHIAAAAIRTIVGPVIAEIFNTGVAVVSIAVEAYEVTKLRIAYYQEYGRIVREDIIPVTALYDAHNQGRTAIRSMGLDPDLEADALEDLEIVRNRRRRTL